MMVKVAFLQLRKKRTSNVSDTNTHVWGTFAHEALRTELSCQTDSLSASDGIIVLKSVLTGIPHVQKGRGINSWGLV